MAVDFSSKVLAPGISRFGRTVVYTPTISQPEADPFEVRGVYDRESTHVDGLADRAPVNIDEITLGVRLADFAVPPARGDSVNVDSVLHKVEDVMVDGQGGADLMLGLVE